MADSQIGIKITADINDAIAAYNTLAAATKEFINKSATEFAGIAIEDVFSQKIGFMIRSIGEITAVVETTSISVATKLKRLQEDIDFVVPSFEQFRGKAIESFIEFDKAIGKVGTLTKDAEGLGVEMRKLSADLGFQTKSAELLENAYDVLSAGFSRTADAVEVTKQATILAKGGFAETKDTVDVLTSALNAYGKGSEFAAQFADQLIQTQNLGKLTVADYARSLGQVVTIAAQAGVEFEELNAIVAVATNKGLGANEAITGLRQAIANTLKPASDAAAFAQTLGIEFNATALETKGFVGILKELNERGLDTPEVLVKLFGSVEAVSALLPSTKEGLAQVSTAMFEIKNASGVASEAMASVANTFAARIEGLKNGLSEGFIAFGASVANGLKPLISETEFYIKKFNELPDAVKGFFVTVTDGLGLVAITAATILPALAANAVAQEIAAVVLPAVNSLIAGFNSLANTNILLNIQFDLTVIKAKAAAAWVLLYETALKALSFATALFTTNQTVFNATFDLAAIKTALLTTATKAYGITQLATNAVIFATGSLLKSMLIGLINLPLGLATLTTATVSFGSALVGNILNLKLFAAAQLGANAAIAQGTALTTGAILKAIVFKGGMFALTQVVAAVKVVFIDLGFALAKLAAQLALFYLALEAIKSTFSLLVEISFGDHLANEFKKIGEINKTVGNIQKLNTEVNVLQKTFEALGAGMDRAKNPLDAFVTFLTNAAAETGRFRNQLNITDAADKFGEDSDWMAGRFKFVTASQKEATMQQIAFTESLGTSFSSSMTQAAQLLQRFGLLTVDAGDAARLSAGDIEIIKGKIAELSAVLKQELEARKNLKIEDESLRAQNQLRIRDLEQQINQMDKAITSLVSYKNTNKDVGRSLEELAKNQANSSQSITNYVTEETVKIKELRAAGTISAQEAAEMERKLLEESLNDRLNLINTLMPELERKLSIANALGKTEDIKAAEDAIKKAMQDLFKIRGEIADNGLKELQRLEVESYKQIETIQKNAVSAASAAEKQRLIDVQTLLNQAVITKQEAESRNLQATQNRINQEIEAEKFKLQALEALPASNDPAKESERNAKIAESKIKLSDLTLSLLKAEETAQQQVRDAVIRGLEEEGRRAKINSEERIAANAAVLNSLKGQQDLFNARNSLEEAQANLTKSRLDIHIKLAKITDDQLTVQKLKLEAVQQEISSQERIFQAQQKSLEISQQIKAAELERQRIVDQIAIKESEIGVLKLKQKKDVTEGELELQVQIVKLNRDNLAETEKAITRQGEINRLKQEELAANQAISRETAQAQRAEELIKQIQEGKIEVTDQLLAQMGLVGTATQSVAQGAGQIYAEFKKSSGEVVVFGGALDGATVKVADLNLGLTDTVSIGDQIGNAFNMAAQGADAIAQAIQRAVENAARLKQEMTEYNRQQAQGRAQREDAEVNQNLAADLAGDLETSREKLLFQLEAEYQRLQGEIGGATGRGIVLGGKFFELKEAVNFLRTASDQDLDRIKAQRFDSSYLGGDLKEARNRARDRLRGYVTPRDLAGFADGGLIRGLGTATSDSIPAMLSNGEFVVNAAATAKNRPILEAINQGVQIPRFAEGGLVGFKELQINQVPSALREAIRAAMASLPGGRIIQNGSGQISVSSQGAAEFERLSRSALQETYSELDRLSENYSELGKVSNTTARSLQNLSSSITTITERIPEIRPSRIPEIRSFNPARLPVAGAVAATPVQNTNTINIVNQPEPELVLRNALLQVVRAV